MDSPINYVAWYGALIATVSLVLGILNYRRDRVKLKVYAETNMRFGDSDENLAWVVVKVANVGRRPVHLATLPYLEIKGQTSGYVLKGEWQPTFVLQEGQSAWLRGKQSGIGADIDRICHVVVKDETGKRWKGKIIRH